MNIDFNAIASAAAGFSAPSIDINSFVTSQPRGLYNFISEIRNTKSKDEERARVDKELANIRQKFANSANLSARDKKKYVWKMCYMYMLGYDIDFGHLEFISLLSSTKFQEKSVGYMALSLMLRSGDDLMTLVVNSMRNDLIGQVLHGQTLALAAVANIGGSDLAEALSADVQRLVQESMEADQYNNPNITAEQAEANKVLLRKKSTLCMLRLFRTNPDCVVPEEWMGRVVRLLEDRDLGVVISAMSLVLGFASAEPTAFESLVPYVISILNRLVLSRTCPADYLYYRTPSPWLQVKCLRFLQYYRMPTDRTQLELLNDILNHVLINTEMSETQNKSNGDHSILFEAINLVIFYGPDAPTFLKEQVCSLLGRFIANKDPNIRYLGLDAMTRMAKLDGPAAVQMHQTTVLDSLRDTDISVRKRSLNLVYVLTDRNNAATIVSDLLSNLADADAAIKEDYVVKIAILAEKFAADLQWYVNTMIQVLLIAGDFVAEAVWYRVVQIVVNNADIHEYAAEKLLATVEKKYVHDNIIAVAAYLLGEIGVNICEQPGMSGYDQFVALHQHYANCSLKVQCILLTTYMKLLNLYPEQTSAPIGEVFEKCSVSAHLELQQRACEYKALPGISADVMEAVLNPMPPFELEAKESSLLSLATGSSHTTGANTDRVAGSGVDGGGGGGGGGGGAAAAMPDVKKPSGGNEPVVDLLSMDDMAGSSPAFSSSSSSSSVGLNGQAAARVPELLRAAALCRVASTKSVLLESDLLRISLSADYRVHQARLAVFLENVSSYEILNLKVTVAVVAGASPASITVRQQDPSVRISPAEEGRMRLALECMRPFPEAYPLEMTVSFTVSGSPYTYALQLPVSATCFFEALPTDKATYMSRWQSIEGPGTEAQEVFTSAKPVDPALLTHIRTVVAPAIRLGFAEGLDNEKTVTGSSSFLTGTVGADGKPVAVGVMMRLEGDPGQNKFRITTRAKHGPVAQALKNFIIAQLGKV